MVIIPRCLTIAGSDSGGGAGIQADLKVFHSLGCFGSSAITCLTAQNTKKVKSIFPVSSAFIAEQIDVVLEDIGSNCIKLGMLLNSDIIYTIAEKLRYYKPILNFKVVIDPVMVSKSGAHLLDTSAVNAFIQELIPLADVLTPNLPEASALLNNSILTQDDMLNAAKELVTLGAKSVVVKGGHLENSDEANDVLFYKTQSHSYEKWFKSQRIITKNTHGTGCTFSAAICAFLAKNISLVDSIENAKMYLTSALAEGKKFQLGNGHGPAKF